MNSVDINWSDKVNALRALGEVSANDYPFPSGNFRELYRYVTVRKEGTAEEIAAVSGEWILIASRVDGYITVSVLFGGAVWIDIAISRPLTEEEIASYADRSDLSFEVAQP